LSLSIVRPERARVVARGELASRSKSIEDLATALDADLAGFTRNLHGQATADLGEMFEWALCLGVQILLEVNSASDLLGPDYAPAP
jgi:hypothetical protein